MLREKIIERIEQIVSEIESSTSSLSMDALSEIEKFADSVLADYDNLDNYEIDPVVDKVYEDDISIDIENYKNQLNSFKKMITVKKNTGSAIFELTDEQKDFIKKFCEDTKKFIIKLKEQFSDSNELVKEKNSYNQIIDKMEKNELLINDDLEKVVDMVNNLDQSEQISILKDFLSYNLSVSNIDIGTKLGSLAPQKPFVSKVDVKKIINKIKEFETDDKKIESYESSINNHVTEVEENTNISNMTEIINFLKEKNIYEKFDPIILLGIMLYGNKKSVEEAYLEFSSKKIDDFDASWLEMDLIYTYPGLWAKQSQPERKRKSSTRKGKDNGEDGGHSYDTSIRGLVNQMFRKELYDKINLFLEYGYSMKDLMNGSIVGLQGNYDNIFDQLKVWDKYGIFTGKGNAKLSALLAGKAAAERCDKAIECGLMNPLAKPTDIGANSYVNHKPTFLAYQSYREPEILLLQILKDNEELLSVMNQNKKFPELSLKKIKYMVESSNIDKEMDKFMKEHHIFTLSEKNMNQFSEMQKNIQDNLVDFRDDIINSEFITSLDANWLTADYKYTYHGKDISRYKVLRLYQSLKDYNNLNPDNAFAEEDIRFFSIVYGSYVEQKVWDKIKNDCYGKQAVRRR